MTTFPNVERVYISFKDRPILRLRLLSFLTYLKALYPKLSEAALCASFQETRNLGLPYS